MLASRQRRVGASNRARRPDWREFPWVAALVAMLALLLSSCSAGGILPVAAPFSRVLFIGNSFTFYNDGVDQQVKGLDPSIAVERQAIGATR